MLKPWYLLALFMFMLVWLKVAAEAETTTSKSPEDDQQNNSNKSVTWHPCSCNHSHFNGSHPWNWWHHNHHRHLWNHTNDYPRFDVPNSDFAPHFGVQPRQPPQSNFPPPQWSHFGVNGPRFGFRPYQPSPPPGQDDNNGTDGQGMPENKPKYGRGRSRNGNFWWGPEVNDLDEISSDSGSTPVPEP